jgi:hypothetical protein
MSKTRKNGRRRGTITDRIRSFFGVSKSKKTSPRPPVPAPAPAPAPAPTPKSPTPRSPTPQKIEESDIDEIKAKVDPGDDIKITKPVRLYLTQLINKTPEEIRQIDKIEDDDILGFGFSDEISDKKMLIRILTEIIELSINATRDGFKKKRMSEKIIQHVLNIKENEYIKRLVV